MITVPDATLPPMSDVDASGRRIGGVGAGVGVSMAGEVRLSEMQFAISFDDAAQDIAQHIRKIRATYEPPGSAGPEDTEIAEFEIQRVGAGGGPGGGPGGGGRISEVRTMSPGRTLQRSRSRSPSATVLDANGNAVNMPMGSQDQRLATLPRRRSKQRFVCTTLKNAALI